MAEWKAGDEPTAKLYAEIERLQAEGRRLQTGFDIYSTEYESAVAAIQHYQEQGEEGDTLGDIFVRIIKERNRFQAIVDTLPDDADGEKVWPGKPVFVNWKDAGIEHMRIHAVHEVLTPGDSGALFYDNVVVPLHLTYSTLKAAKEASDD